MAKSLSKYKRLHQMMKKLFLVLITVVGFSTVSFSQSDFYDSGSVREIRIYFEDDNWKYILDSLFLSGDSYSKVKADVKIDGTTYSGCGIRYKGFSSWNEDETKNPFSINLDYSNKNQNHQGYKKLKLSNVIYDPSFVREVLAYSIARKYMPTSEANFANLYINDTLIGLYTNVESVDDCFTEKHFVEKDNPFFKGNPETLVYPFGQNANLAYTHGEDSVEYMPFYSLESEYGWEELFHFIDVLNNDTANIPEVLNVDRALWMHAFNYSILNLDSYIAYAQNFYLYQDRNQRFNTILWDLNMSFGSFRHSDGATNFQGVTMTKLPILNPLQHLTFSISPRPLMKNLFLNSTYKKMYLAHIRTIINENIINGEYLVEAEQLHDLISASVVADTNKFYSNQDFEDNLYSSTGVSTEQFPGIRDLMVSRAAYLTTFAGISGYPIIDQPVLSSAQAIRNESIGFTIKVSGATKVLLYYRNDVNGVFMSSLMNDDGDDGDVLAGDSLFYTQIVPTGKNFEYYFWAENSTSGAFLPERAAYEFFNLPTRTEPGDIFVNEIIYNNYDFNQTVEFSDIEAVEIYNPWNEDLYLNNLSMRFINTGFDVGDTVIAARKFLLVYPQLMDVYSIIDENKNSSLLQLLTDDNLCVDSFTPEVCSDNRSVGRFPDGQNKQSVLVPTPGSFNTQPENINKSLLVYPVPADEVVYVEMASLETITQVFIYNSLGNVVYRSQPSGSNYLSITVDVKDWLPSVYYISAVSENRVFNSVFIKI